MRLVCLSDQHGHLPDHLPEGDVLVLGGDLCPIDDHAIAAQAAWLDGPFRAWLEGAGFARIVGIAGNHDFVFEAGQQPRDLPWTYLQDGAADIAGVRFYGFPWTPILGPWAFEATPEQMQEHLAHLTAAPDVLVAHGPPGGCLDRTWRGERVGSLEVREAVLHHAPRLVVSGHIHESHGRARLGCSDVVNASLLDERYEPVFAPVVVDLPVE